ncbi:MAG: hypothetical protein PHP65_01465 [Bacilli bacterium]|nr:hypothetical protein [Bacilli bacterium]
MEFIYVLIGYILGFVTQYFFFYKNKRNEDKEKILEVIRNIGEKCTYGVSLGATEYNDLVETSNDIGEINKYIHNELRVIKIKYMDSCIELNKIMENFIMVEIDHRKLMLKDRNFNKTTIESTVKFVSEFNEYSKKIAKKLEEIYHKI